MTPATMYHAWDEFIPIHESLQCLVINKKHKVKQKTETAGKYVA